jgi:hypothetical protein
MDGMGIAILLYGMYREFDTAVKFWRFKDEIDCDFYFSTWSKSFTTDNNSGDFHEFDVTKEMILNHLPNATISIEDEVKFHNEVYGVPITRTHSPFNYEKMIYHWKKTLTMVEESGKHYDVIVLMRPDFIYEFNFPFIELFKCNEEDTIYTYRDTVYETEEGYSIDDVFFLGNYNVISKFIKLTPKRNKGPHKDTYNHIKSLNLKLKQKDGVRAHLLRANVKELLENELTLDNVINKLKTWVIK